MITSFLSVCHPLSIRFLSFCDPILFLSVSILLLSFCYPFSNPVLAVEGKDLFLQQQNDTSIPIPVLGAAIKARILFLQRKASVCSCNSISIPGLLFLVQLARLASCSCSGMKVFALVKQQNDTFDSCSWYSYQGSDPVLAEEGKCLFL